MYPHKLTLHFFASLLILGSSNSVIAQKQKPPSGGRPAVIVDERLAVLRSTPGFEGKFLRRLPRGKPVAIRAAKSADGLVFLLINVSSRTHGWIQREAVASSVYSDEDQRVFALIRNSTDYERIVRSRIFLEAFSRSRLRPQVLLLLGDAAELMAEKLTRDASRKLKDGTTIAVRKSYYLNYSGLDRYSRQGVYFVFDDSENRFHYNGKAWRQLVSLYPHSQEAGAAKERLKKISQ